MERFRLILFILVLFALCPLIHAAETPTALPDYPGSADFNIYIWPVNFTSGESNYFETKLEYYFDFTTGTLWDTNWFSDNKSSFKVYKVISAGVWGKTESEIIALLDDIAGGQFRDSYTSTSIDVLIDYDSLDGVNSTKSVGSESWVYLKYSGTGYHAGHEIGVHVLGWQYGSATQTCFLDDEYNGGCCDGNANSMYQPNVHDQNSNEKWEDIESGSPSTCVTGGVTFYVPTSSCIASNGTSNQNFCGVCSAAIDKGVAKRLESDGFDTTSPTVSGVSIENDSKVEVTSGIPQTAYDEAFTINLTASDASGIRQVEFYIKPDGGEYTSFGIDDADDAEPTSYMFSMEIDPSDYTPGSYTIRMVVHDTFYNFTESSSYWVHFFTRVKGCTCAFFIDEDCDGYGVGDGYVTDADADDDDYTINTTATVESEYGAITSGTSASAKANLLSFLSERNAASYTGIDNVWYVAADGNDGTGTVNDYNYPYASWGQLEIDGLDAGDLVIYRDGEYDQSEDQIHTQYGGVEGAEGSPIVVMSMPGELAIFTHSLTKIYQQMNQYWTFDTLQLGTADSDTASNGYSGKGIQNITCKYLECVRNNLGSRVMAGVQYNQDFIWDHCLVNRAHTSHNMYWGGSTGSYRLKMTNSISYGNASSSGYTGLHMNGPGWDNLIDNNMFHSHSGKGFDFMNGMCDSVVSNNLFFNNNGFAATIEYYGSGAAGPPLDNLFINNVFWEGRYNNGNPGGDPSARSCVNITNYRDEGYDDDLPLTGNDFVNNIFVTYGGGGLRFLPSDMLHYSGTSYYNNIVYATDGGEETFAKKEGEILTLSEFETEVNNEGGVASDNIYQDPSFTDVSHDYAESYGSFDFSIVSDSPAVDSGITTFRIPNQVPTNDIAGDNRDASPDIGAYEYGEGGNGGGNGSGSTTYGVTFSTGVSFSN